MTIRNREALQRQFEKDGKTNYVRTEDVDEEIMAVQYHHFAGTTVMVCCLTLKNGFAVIGSSSCVNPHNFELRLSRQLAHDGAKQKIFKHLAFRILDSTRPDAMTA